MIWIWHARTPGARLARLALLPAAAVFHVTAGARAKAYRSGWLPSSRLPAPSVAVGSLAVGGAGKTPLAAWIAGYYARSGLTPGILLRGYGGDEADVHRRAVPRAVVIEHADRVRAARRAVARGADVLVLDDAFQRLDVRRDLNVAVVSAESLDAAPWTLPAGPWRESWRALRRADLVVVTVKSAGEARVRATIERVRAAGRRPVAVARLRLARLRGLLSERERVPAELVGSRVLAGAGIADPEAFAAQLREYAATVALLAWRDHHRFVRADVARMLSAAKEVDYVVVTAKDASKLRGLWPRDAAEPLVAELEVVWQEGHKEVERALSAAVGGDVTGMTRRRGSIFTSPVC